METKVIVGQLKRWTKVLRYILEMKILMAIVGHYRNLLNTHFLYFKSHNSLEIYEGRYV